MARKELKTNVGIVAQLKAVMTSPDDVVYAIKRELIETGHLQQGERVTTDAVKAAGRGRHKIKYEVTNKGKNLIRLSTNWKTV